LLNAAQSAVIASAVTEGLFNVNILEFLTGRIDGKFAPGGDGGANITAPELLGFTSAGWMSSRVGGNYGTGKTFGDQVRYNLSRNGTKMAATLVMAPIAFTVAQKLTAKPRRDANKLLKMAGLSQVVKV